MGPPKSQREAVFDRLLALLEQDFLPALPADPVHVSGLDGVVPHLFLTSKDTSIRQSNADPPPDTPYLEAGAQAIRNGMERLGLPIHPWELSAIFREACEASLAADGFGALMWKPRA